MSIESRRSRLRRPNMRRAAPALPNGFTLGNLFFGIFAIVSASRGSFDHAVLFVVLGGVCDAFDGAVARATRTGSRFGEELDSLVDAISFGLAPAMMVYFSTLPREGWAWFPVFIFAACAVLRLARFNVTQAGESKSYFIGLPSPAAGGTLATYYWFTQTTLYNQTRIIDLPWQEIMRYLMILLAFLMISPVPYPAWPKVGIRSWRGVGGLILVLGIVLGATLYSKYFFFLFGLSYVAYGLVRAVVLALLDRPPGGMPRRRSTDYIDPMESYGMHTGEHARHAIDDADDIDDSDEALDEREDRVADGWTRDAPSQASPPSASGLFATSQRTTQRMSAFRVEIRVVPRRGILDPQGKAVADALHSLGFADVTDVRVGRHIVVEANAADADAAGRAVREMCERLLANPVTEDFEIEQVVATGGA